MAPILGTNLHIVPLLLVSLKRVKIRMDFFQ